MKRLGFDLIVLGDPTAGKDTQASLLMKKYSFNTVETGKQWRIMVKKNDFRGRWLKRTFGLGHPAPVEIVKWFIGKKVKTTPQNKDLMFIGNPRLKPEAQFLVKLLKEKNRNFLALYLKLPEKEIYRRSQGRIRMAKEGELQYIRNRINYHKNQVSKTVAYFKSLNKLKLINGNQRISKVTADIQKAINTYHKA